MSNTIIFAGDECVGTDDQTAFTVMADSNKVLAALEIAAQGELYPNQIDLIDNFNTIVRECVTAICWEAEDTIKTYISLIKGDGRFAIHHGELIFGVGVDHNQAMQALHNEEF